MTLTPIAPMKPCPDAPQRAHGAAALSVRASPRGSAIDGLRQSGSLRLLFPRVPAGVGAVLLNTAGGLTGGDDFALTAEAGAGAELTLSTQAAERAYRACPGEVARMRARLSVGAGARLDWLPQETILYDGCALDRGLTANLEEGATLLLAEPLVFGRRAMGERLRRGRFRDRIEVRRGGVPLYLDAFTLAGDIDAHLARPQVAGGMGAMATLVLAAPGAADALPPLRVLLPATAGASAPRDDLLVARILAPDSHELRRTLVPVLNRLTGDRLPRAWMI